MSHEDSSVLTARSIVGGNCCTKQAGGDMAKRARIEGSNRAEEYCITGNAGRLL